MCPTERFPFAEVLSQMFLRGSYRKFVKSPEPCEGNLLSAALVGFKEIPPQLEAIPVFSSCGLDPIFVWVFSKFWA